MISVIIPTLNEENHIESLISTLSEYDIITEIIVIDGGSTDNTCNVVGRFQNVKLIKTNRGRGVQMNAGASCAKNDILFFLHADSSLSKTAIEQIPEALDGEVVAGSFYLKFDIDQWLLRMFSKFSKINWSILTYGDQGLFLRKATFEKLGGFKSIPILEDYEMVRNLKRRGKFVKLNYPVVTSSRRFLKYGIIFQQLRNILLVILYNLGVSSRCLANFYKY